jgi:hypothetical protein
MFTVVRVKCKPQFKNSWFQGTTYMHQVMLQTQEHFCGNRDKTWVNIITKEPNSSPLNKKLVLSMPEHSEQVKLNIKHMLMFSTSRSLFIKNFLQATQLTRTTNGRFCNIWGSRSTQNAKNSQTRTQ